MPIPKLRSLLGRQIIRSWLSRGKDASMQTGKLVELVAFAGVVPVCGLLIFPHDPVGLLAGFPWVAVAPLLFAARYGSSWGVACSLVLAIILNLPIEAYAAMSEQHLTLSLGVVIVSLLIGDAASTWRKRSCTRILVLGIPFAKNTRMRQKVWILITFSGRFAACMHRCLNYLT